MIKKIWVFNTKIFICDRTLMLCIYLGKYNVCWKYFYFTTAVCRHWDRESKLSLHFSKSKPHNSILTDIDITSCKFSRILRSWSILKTGIKGTKALKYCAVPVSLRNLTKHSHPQFLRKKFLQFLNFSGISVYLVSARWFLASWPWSGQWWHTYSAHVLPLPLISLGKIGQIYPYQIVTK